MTRHLDHKRALLMKRAAQGSTVLLGIVAVGFAALAVPGTGEFEVDGPAEAAVPPGGAAANPQAAEPSPSDRPVNFTLVAQSLGQLRNAPVPPDPDETEVDPTGPEDSPPTPEQQTIANADVIPQDARFLGTMRGRAGWRAVLGMPDGQRLVRVGDTVSGLEVVEISETMVRFEGPRGPGELERAPINRSDSNLATAGDPRMRRSAPAAVGGPRNPADELDPDQQRRIEEMRERREEILRRRRERQENAGQT
ncbi:MAG: hypothetical protein AAGG07_09520 [Planctomycetota bacterium]